MANEPVVYKVYMTAAEAAKWASDHPERDEPVPQYNKEYQKKRREEKKAYVKTLERAVAENGIVITK